MNKFIYYLSAFMVIFECILTIVRYHYDEWNIYDTGAASYIWAVTFCISRDVLQKEKIDKDIIKIIDSLDKPSVEELEQRQGGV